jgi:gluconokinase
MTSVNVILSLDVGTSSTRVRVYTADTGQALPAYGATHAHTPTRTDEGGEVLDPDALVAEVVACLMKTLVALPTTLEIMGVGMSCFWHSIIGLDTNNTPLTPILLWSDRRSAPQVARLKEAFPLAPQITGCPWHTSYVPGRLLWLAEANPEIFARCTRFVSPAEYIFGVLFGFENVTVSRCMASATGLLNQQTGNWHLEAVPQLSTHHFSPISDAPVTDLRAAFAAQVPALAHIPWFPALGDGACSNMGCGAMVSGKIALMIGTSGAMRVVTLGLPPLPDGLWRYQIDASRGALGGALSNGGSVWEWLSKTLVLDSNSSNISNSEVAFAALTPDSHGLTVLPFLSGERAPLWQDGLTATIHGLTAATTPIEIAQAFREAVAYRFASIRERLKSVAPSAQIIATGAALRLSPTWAQTIADVLGESLHFVDEEEASARGAALWVREKLGLGGMEDAPAPSTIAIYTPNSAATKIYQAARERHEALRALLEKF